jgi:hypothetical protein
VRPGSPRSVPEGRPPAPAPLTVPLSLRKKKKKDKDKAKMLEAMGTSKKSEEEKRRCLDKRTPAQAAFEKMQEKRVRQGQNRPAPTARVAQAFSQLLVAW